jgi:arylsulfatase A-like enzyme
MQPHDDSHPVVHVTQHGNARGGMHGTLSSLDLRNIAVAAGPDFRRGVTNPLPTGNVDIVPTFLWLMGIESPSPLDGRVMSEALSIEGPALRSTELGRLEARAELPGGVWEQYLKFTEINGVRYLDEGNGRWIARETD